MKIKFRAWDRELNRMLNVAKLDFEDWWVNCERPSDAPSQNGDNFYGERNSFTNSDTDRHILMQYSGLKDKNGKEIYEGDIVKTEHKGLYSQGIIVFSNGMYQLKCGEGLFFFQANGVEVIGNVFENPELTEVL